jgi:predicted transposase/invertase (TIGR01784 family)
MEKNLRKAHSSQEKKIKLLWLRFMREITDQTREVDPALFEVPEIKEALSLAEEAAYSPAELEAYEEYWKAVSSERTIRNDSLLKGRLEGKAETTLELAKEFKRKGVPLAVIAECTGLSMAEIERL